MKAILTVSAFSTLSVLIAASCMEKKCYTCVKNYPVVVADTIMRADSAFANCNVTAEKKKHLQQTYDTTIYLNGNPHTLLVIVTCN